MRMTRRAPVSVAQHSVNTSMTNRSINKVKRPLASAQGTLT
jgi:hypothetical protein